MPKFERVEILKTLKVGKGRENTYYKGRILTGGEITPEIMREISLKRRTVRVLDGPARSSSSPTIEVKEGMLYVDGKCQGRVVPLEEENKRENIAEEDKPSEEEDTPKSDVTRRKRSVSN